MIIIGVGMASDRLFATHNTTTQQTTTADIRDFERAQHSAAGAFRLARIANGSVDGHEMKSIAVHITQHRETDVTRYSCAFESGIAGGSGSGGGYGRDTDMEAETERTKCSVDNCEGDDGVRDSIVIVEHPDMSN